MAGRQDGSPPLSSSAPKSFNTNKSAPGSRNGSFDKDDSYKKRECSESSPKDPPATETVPIPIPSHGNLHTAQLLHTNTEKSSVQETTDQVDDESPKPATSLEDSITVLPSGETMKSKNLCTQSKKSSISSPWPSGIQNSLDTSEPKKNSRENSATLNCTPWPLRPSPPHDESHDDVQIVPNPTCTATVAAGGGNEPNDFSCQPLPPSYASVCSTYSAQFVSDIPREKMCDCIVYHKSGGIEIESNGKLQFRQANGQISPYTFGLEVIIYPYDPKYQDKCVTEKYAKLVIYLKPKNAESFPEDLNYEMQITSAKISSYEENRDLTIKCKVPECACITIHPSNDALELLTLPDVVSCVEVINAKGKHLKCELEFKLTVTKVHSDCQVSPDSNLDIEVKTHKTTPAKATAQRNKWTSKEKGSASVTDGPENSSGNDSSSKYQTSEYKDWLVVEQEYQTVYST